MPNIPMVTCAKSYITSIIVSPVKSQVNGVKKHKNICRKVLTNTHQCWDVNRIYLYFDCLLRSLRAFLLYWNEIGICLIIFWFFPRGLDSYCWQRNDNKWDPIQKFSHHLPVKERETPIYLLFSSSFLFLSSLSFPLPICPLSLPLLS